MANTYYAAREYDLFQTEKALYLSGKSLCKQKTTYIYRCVANFRGKIYKKGLRSISRLVIRVQITICSFLIIIILQIFTHKSISLSCFCQLHMTSKAIKTTQHLFNLIIYINIIQIKLDTCNCSNYQNS